jgi:hypothetical protein
LIFSSTIFRSRILLNEVKAVSDAEKNAEPHISNIKIPINTGLPPSTKITLLKNTYLFSFLQLNILL